MSIQIVNNSHAYDNYITYYAEHVWNLGKKDKTEEGRKENLGIIVN